MSIDTRPLVDEIYVKEYLQPQPQPYPDYPAALQVEKSRVALLTEQQTELLQVLLWAYGEHPSEKLYNILHAYGISVARLW